MAQRKGNRWKVLPRGTFDGKKVTFAETDQVDAHGEFAAQFMSTIFDLNPGDCLITDESDVRDFVPFDEPDTAATRRRIQ